MTARTVAERLRNHVAPSRAEMAAYADELEALAARVEALAVVPRRVAEHNCFKPWCPWCTERKTYEAFVRSIRAALDGA